MVFDTRGRRKHVVRVVYAILALLMGASLFLVVGPFNVGNLIGGSSSTNAAKVLNEQAERVEKKLRTEPTNEDLLLALTRSRISAGNALTEVSPESGLPTLTAEGRQQLAFGTEAWNRYLKEAKDPSYGVALLVARAYFSLAETSPNLEETEEMIENAGATQRLAAESRPSVGTLSTLAIDQYYAGDFAAGDKTALQAIAAAPKAEAKEIKKTMVEYRARGKSFQEQKAKFAKLEKSHRKEALENPLGGLGGPGLGE
jgi:hypothetical protein